MQHGRHVAGAMCLEAVSMNGSTSSGRVIARSELQRLFASASPFLIQDQKGGKSVAILVRRRRAPSSFEDRDLNFQA
jgi:hypothetical protein